VITDSCQIKWRPCIKVALRDVKCLSSNPQVTYYRHGCKWWHICLVENFCTFTKYIFARKTARIHMKCVAVSTPLPLHRTAITNFAKQPVFSHSKRNYLSQTKGVYFSWSLRKPNSRSKYRCHPRSLHCLHTDATVRNIINKQVTGLRLDNIHTKLHEITSNIRCREENTTAKTLVICLS
jgi:hypothetical protein